MESNDPSSLSSPGLPSVIGLRRPVLVGCGPGRGLWSLAGPCSLLPQIFCPQHAGDFGAHRQLHRITRAVGATDEGAPGAADDALARSAAGGGDDCDGWACDLRRFPPVFADDIARRRITAIVVVRVRRRRPSRTDHFAPSLPRVAAQCSAAASLSGRVGRGRACRFSEASTPFAVLRAPYVGLTTPIALLGAGRPAGRAGGRADGRKQMAWRRARGVLRLVLSAWRGCIAAARRRDLMVGGLR